MVVEDRIDDDVPVFAYRRVEVLRAPGPAAGEGENVRVRLPKKSGRLVVRDEMRDYVFELTDGFIGERVDKSVDTHIEKLAKKRLRADIGCTEEELEEMEDRTDKFLARMEEKFDKVAKRMFSTWSHRVAREMHRIEEKFVILATNLRAETDSRVTMEMDSCISQMKREVRRRLAGVGEDLEHKIGLEMEQQVEKLKTQMHGLGVNVH